LGPFVYRQRLSLNLEGAWRRQLGGDFVGSISRPHPSRTGVGANRKAATGVSGPRLSRTWARSSGPAGEKRSPMVAVGDGAPPSPGKGVGPRKPRRGACESVGAKRSLIGCSGLSSTAGVFCRMQNQVGIDHTAGGSSGFETIGDCSWRGTWSCSLVEEIRDKRGFNDVEGRGTEAPRAQSRRPSVTPATPQRKPHRNP